MCVATVIISLVVLILSIALFHAEQNVQSGSFEQLIVTLQWAYMWCLDNPYNNIVYEPLTCVGRLLIIALTIVKIAIVAVPAGLLTEGFLTTVGEEKRARELNEYYERIKKSFRRSGNKTLRTYLNGLPNKGGNAFTLLNFVPQHIPVSRLQIRQGLNHKDIFNVCLKYPDLCLKNLADATENPTDEQFVVEMFAKNRPYGCCINRNSKVTIVCPTGFSEVGIGWFGYYLSKLGGFNYVCKSIEADPNELDSFYNLSDEPLYNKMTRAEFTRKDTEALQMLTEKENLREAFLGDLKAVVNKDSWVIILADHQKNEENTIDLHFASALKDSTQTTILDDATYKALYETLSSVVSTEFGMTTIAPSARYPLMKKNLAYRLQGEGIECNTFVLRPSADLININEKKLVVALRMAQVISQQLDEGKGVREEDVKDFASTGFGYMEHIP